MGQEACDPWHGDQGGMLGAAFALAQRLHVPLDL